jgi:hypothetical protein
MGFLTVYTLGLKMQLLRNILHFPIACHTYAIFRHGRYRHFTVSKMLATKYKDNADIYKNHRREKEKQSIKIHLTRFF